MQMVAEMTVLNAEYLESILGEHSIDLFYLLIGVMKVEPAWAKLVVGDYTFEVTSLFI